MNHLLILAAALYGFPFIGFARMSEALAADDKSSVTINGKKISDREWAPDLATGFDGDAMDAPFSVTTLSGSRVREQGGTTLHDALRNIPGVQADSGFNGSHTQSYLLRGAISDSGTGANRVVRDGIRLSNYPYVPAFVKRIDVLRGPGAASSVRSEPGGTVNIATHQPRFTDFGSIYLNSGSEGAREASVDLNRVLSRQGQFAGRIIATRSDSSEWRQVPDKLDGVKVMLAKSYDARYQLSIGYEATNQDYRPDFGVPALNGRPVRVPRNLQLGEPFGDSTIRNRIYDFHVNVALDTDTKFKLDAAYLNARSSTIKNMLVGPLAQSHPIGTFARMSVWEPETERSISSLMAAMSTSRRVDEVVHRSYLGIGFYREMLYQPSLSIPALSSPPINVYSPIYGRVTAPQDRTKLRHSLVTQDLSSVGITAQDEFDVGSFSIVAGLRFEKQEFVYGQVGILPVSETTWSPKLALLFRKSPGDSIYVNVTTGTSPNQAASSSNQSLPSRKSSQVEGGWKSSWLAGTLSSNVAIYQLDQKNMISSDLSTPSNQYDFTTAGSAQSQGLEASIEGDIALNIGLMASYAYTTARYRQNSLHSGKLIPNVGRHSLSVWTEYRWDGRSKTRLGVYAQGRRYADESNSTLLPGYARLDFVHSWSQRFKTGHFIETQLAVRNLLDANYYASSHLHVSRWITPGQGRNIALSVSYHF